MFQKTLILLLVTSAVLAKLDDVPEKDIFDNVEEDIPKKDISDDFQENASSTCIGNQCMKTTCLGECRPCPSGRCCDGSSCNICHERRCCQTRTCNTCFRQCRSNCQYSSCYSNCYSSCLNGRRPCTENGHDCSHKTRKNKNVVVNLPSVNSRKMYNVTTLINITNLINNTNEVDSPVFVNNTNRNNFDVNYTLPNGQFRQHAGPCCYILHPLQCVNTPQGNKCHRKKDKTCGPICLTQQQVPGPPRIVENAAASFQQPKCYPIAHYPFTYCPMPTESNCDACFTCPEIAQEECIKSKQCPAHCQKGLSSSSQQSKPENSDIPVIYLPMDTAALQQGHQQLPIQQYSSMQQYPNFNQMVHSSNPAQNIPVSSISQPTNLQFHASNIPLHTSNVPVNSNIQLPTSNVYIPTSNLQVPNVPIQTQNQPSILPLQTLYGNIQLPNIQNQQLGQSTNIPLSSSNIFTYPGLNLQASNVQPLSNIQVQQGNNPYSMELLQQLAKQQLLLNNNQQKLSILPTSVQDPTTKVVVVDGNNQNSQQSLDYLKQLLNIAQPINKPQQSEHIIKPSANLHSFNDKENNNNHDFNKII